MTPRPLAIATALVVLAALGTACSPPTIGGPCDPFSVSGSPGEACPQQMYFPTGLGIDPRGDTLYVSNGNADLRYSGGTVQAIDLRAFDCAYQYARTGTWPSTCSSTSQMLLKCAMDYASSMDSASKGFAAIPPGCDADRLQQLFPEGNRARIGDDGLCRPDLLDPAILECDEQLLVAGALAKAQSVSQGAVRVGNFAGELRFQPRVGGTTKGRVWLAVRGDPSITFIDVTRGADGDVQLQCVDEPEAGLAPNCKNQRITVRDFHDEHHLTCDSAHTDNCVPVPAEPFGLAYDEGAPFGVCLDGSPCDATSPCADGTRCLFGVCSDGVVCNASTSCADKGSCLAGVCHNGVRCGPDKTCDDQQGCLLPPVNYQHLLVSHLLGGEVMLINAAVDHATSTTGVHPTEAVVLDVRGVGFDADSAGRRGGFGLAAREPGNPRSLWYASSRVNPRIAAFRIGLSNIVLPFQLFSIAGPFNSGDDVRDLVFDPCDDRGPGNQGCRAFAVQNHPPSLFTLDTRIDPLRVPAGVPQNTVADIVSVCQGPSHLAFRSFRDGPGGTRRNRVYVLCYSANQMAVVDPDLAQLVDSVLVGRGPNEIAFNFGGELGETAHPRAFVTNFLDNSISVVDLELGSSTENHVVARIGFTEPPRLQ